MKNLIYLGLSIFLISCSKDDDCQGKKNEINSYYDKQVEYINNNPGPDGIDYRQLGLVNNERNNKLANACD